MTEMFLHCKRFCPIRKCDQNQTPQLGVAQEEKSGSKCTNKKVCHAFYFEEQIFIRE